MRSLRDVTIKNKLLAITMVTLAASLLLAGIGIVIADSVLFRAGMQRDLAALANLVGYNSTAALSFDDPNVAKGALTALRAKPHMITACIYKPDGTILAQYAQAGSDGRCETPSSSDEVRFTQGELIASHPVILDNQRIGTVVLRYDLYEAAERTRLIIGIVLLILLTSSFVAFLLATRLQKVIVTPISRLADAATAVSQTGDYSVRVTKDSQDELGVLVSAFNEMLSRVELRTLEAQNARYLIETTLTSIGDAVISVNTEGRIMFANPVARVLLRRTEKDLEGKPVEQVFTIHDGDTRAPLETPIHRVLRERTIVGSSENSILITADGDEFPVESSAAPIRDVHGVIMGVVLVFRDISERRATEKLLETQAIELRERTDSLKEAHDRKDQFLAMLAHELRNPLAPILNAVQVLKMSGTSDPRQKWVGDVIERQTQHLARLVDDLLDVSRITRGKVTLQRELLELSTIISRAVETSRPIIDARKHRLDVVLPKEPIRLHGDLTRLIQVIGNLLNNAAKFTEPGGAIRVEAECVGTEVFIRVIDNGIGLPADLVPHVFDLFIQADQSLDRTQGGLGIGLTLVRYLVELHGGSVDVHSKPGEGSEFIVRLPVLDLRQSDALTPSDDEASRPYDRLRILVLEDNVDAAEMLRHMLQLRGHEVRAVFDGEVGLETAYTFHPHVVLCDIGLPRMSGYEVAVRLRSQQEFKSTRLIALSGYGQEGDRVRSKEAGFDYHLTKPVEPDTLLELLGTFGSA
jgi:PAS domain S-box-containing protein